MDVNSSKDATEGKSKQNGLLVLLLILVAGFGYVYFFTDLIKPSQEQKVAEAPPVAQVVKKPLPSPDGKPAKVAAADDEGEGKKNAAPPAKPEPAKVAAAPAPAPAPAVKPAAKPVEKEAAKPKEPAKKDETPQQSVKKPLPAAAAKPAPADKKQPAAARDGDKKVADAKKGAEKPATGAAPAPVKKDTPKPAKKEPAVAASGITSDRWTVVVGNYVLEEALATDLARVRKAGFEAYVVPAGPKKTHMTRLLLAEFTDRVSAQAELDKLKRHTSDAFIIDSAGMHMVYAGSYMLDSRATYEKDRLTAAGFGLTLKKADVSIPSKNLTAGSYVEKSAAEDVLKKLKAAGVKASLSR